jgi:AbrB family looped-hinge helix DNA binding protein
MWAHSVYGPHRFTVHLDERGRLAIPAEVRRSVGVTRGDPLALDLDENGEVFEVRIGPTPGAGGREVKAILREHGADSAWASELRALRESLSPQERHRNG